MNIICNKFSPFFSLAVALISFGLIACGEDSGTSSKSHSDTSTLVESFDDLPNCSKNRNGVVIEIPTEKKAYVCDNKRWEFDHDILDTVQTEDDLNACLSKNEGDSVWVVEESAIMVCTDRKWEKHVKEEPSNENEIPIYKSEDDLPNCTKARQGKLVLAEAVAWQCDEERWQNLGHAYNVEDDLPNCTSKLNKEKAYILENGLSMTCVDKRWTESDSIEVAEPVSSSSEKKSSSSAKKESSSSTKNSSSSAKVTSSSSAKASSSSTKTASSSSAKVTSSSSSSAKSSSSSKVQSSSSAKVSSSSTTVASSSSKTVVPSSSSQKAASSSSSKVASSSSTSNLSSSSQKAASSSSGKANWAYLNPNVSYGEMTDARDNQVYKTVKINDNVWLAENLNYKTSTSYCMKDDSTYCEKYGRLYNLDVAQTICPEGWKLPSIDDWHDLYAAAQKIQPDSLARYVLWSKSFTKGTNELGFSGTPTSVWDINRSSQGYIAQDDAFYWSSTGNNTFELYTHSVYFGFYSSRSRLAVRCIKK